MDHVEHSNGLRRGSILSGLILGLALSAIEVSIVATAMPSVIEDLGGQHLYSLPFAIYLLFATVSSPLWGYAADRYGSRRLYLVAIALFLLGSALCGAATSMVSLVAFRVLQGLGGGGLQTITFTIVGELYPLNERSKIQGYISAVWGVSALIGPLIGGFIVDSFSWRWVFYINIPFGLAGAALVYLNYQDWLRPKAGRMDLLGATIFTTGATLLVYGLQTRQLALVLLGGLVLVIFPPIELRQPTPLVPLRLLRDPLLMRTIPGNVLAGMAFFGFTAYLPLYVQQALDRSATVAGALLSPTTVGWTVSSIIAARFIPRAGLRTVARVGAVGMAAGSLLIVASVEMPRWLPQASAAAAGAPAPGPAVSLWLLGASGLVTGMGMGSIMLALLLGAQEQAPREQLGSITALTLFSRSIGGALGSALMGALLGFALEQGGPTLGATFWRVPATSAILAVLVLLIVFRLPEVRQSADSPEAAARVNVGEEVQVYESSPRREPGP